MNSFKSALAIAVVATGFAAMTPKAEAGVAIAIGPAPVCSYGYYDYAPYRCAPYGYYGPEWFSGGGIFIGAGPWFHGPRHFHGYVDNRFDGRHHYRGPMPQRGSWHFRGNEIRDGRGYAHRR
jgi:hypothetical protein